MDQQLPGIHRFAHVYERGIIQPRHIAVIESLYQQFHTSMTPQEGLVITSVNPTYLVAALLEWRYGIRYMTILKSYRSKEKQRAVDERVQNIINMICKHSDSL
jgi:hypothetical protein